MAEWRTGRSVGRTIYRVNVDGSEELVGVMDTRELAAEVVEALNGREPEEERPDECCCAGCIGMGPCDDDLGKSDDEDKACVGLDCDCADCRAEWSEYGP